MSYIFDDADKVHDAAVPLSEIVLQNEATNAFPAAPAADGWFQETFLQQGTFVALADPPATVHAHNYVPRKAFVKMTNPTSRGCVRPNLTQIFVVRADLAEDEAQAQPPEQQVEQELELEIDEGFLESSMLGSDEIHGALRQSFSLGSARTLPSLKDDHTVYVRTGDLSRLGFLSGDWAVISPSDKATARLVRVEANESVLLGIRQTVQASPLLVRNIVPQQSLIHSSQVILSPTPHGSIPPAVPTARTVTVARLASPISVDRAFQAAFVHGLHAWFRESVRLMKQGDMIAVDLNTDSFHGVAGQVDDTSEMDDLDFENRRSLCTNEAAYFVVTNMEYEAVPTDSPASDVHTGIATGEWGCWVDPAVTRIIQAGIEHGLVPDVLTYSASPISQRPAFEKLFALVRASLSPNAVEYGLQVSILLKGARGTGKMTTVRDVARHLGMHLLELNCYDAIGDNDTQTEGLLRARFEKASSCSPCLFVLRHVDALSQTTQSAEAGKAFAIADTLSNCIESLHESWTLTSFPVVVVATTDRPEETAPRIAGCFKHELVFIPPEEAERQGILDRLVQKLNVAPDVSLQDYAVQTAALVPSDLVDLVSRSEYAYLKRAMHTSGCSGDVLFRAGPVIDTSDLEVALSKARASYAESIGAPKIPNVTWDDVGGLASVKADILDTIQLPLDHPELFSHGLKKRSGILLYGPPGTGKTLLAKAVATSCSLNFFSVKGPELLNMYIGESEANVRRVFQRARDAKPCVIFFDELDSVAPKRGAHGDSGGVMDRIVSQLLAELDGVAAGESGADVFVIGATNRPDLLDPALLRPGRFDRMLYLGVSQTHEAQLNILHALTRKFKLHPDLRLERIADACPFHYTGADFYALCSDALLKAMSRKAEELEAKIATLNTGAHDPRHPYPLTPQYYLAEMASTEEIEVLVSQEDFEAALRSLIPSVSQAEMDHYARVQQQFSKETINSTAS